MQRCYYGPFGPAPASDHWRVDRIRHTVVVMSDPEQEPHSHPSPGIAMFSNWATYDAAFATKLRLAASNTMIKLRKRQGCCGHHGQPGC